MIQVNDKVMKQIIREEKLCMMFLSLIQVKIRK